MCGPAVAAGSERLSELPPERSRGVVSGLYDSAVALGAGTAAPITGLLIDNSSPAVAIAAIALIAILLAGIARLLAGRQH